MFIATMMARNEERWVGGALAACAEACDGIVFFNDRSTDRTREIAAANPKMLQILDSPWDDWNEVRTRKLLLTTALEKFEADWILVMDADEVLVDPEEVRSIVRNPGSHNVFKGKYLYFWDSLDTVRVDGWFANPQDIKLFDVHDRRGEILAAMAHWVGSGEHDLHSGPMPTSLGWRRGPETFTFKHYGLLDPEVRRAKFERYTANEQHPRGRQESGLFEHLMGRPNRYCSGPPVLKKWPF